MIEVYTDGASSGNPGRSGAGIYIKANGKKHEYSIPLGTTTNHEAEFLAVIKALDICTTLFPDEILSFRSDSQLVVDAVLNEQTKNKAFQPLLATILDKASIFPHFFIKWIPSAQNIHADRLAKQAIRKQETK